ncbi:hypothetical protein M3Y95_01063100 [Aphelenchoides besseyi]|nr:hypothetical protein M3Y95_01063100 [Aphelenchoides besseyi]
MKVAKDNRDRMRGALGINDDDERSSMKILSPKKKIDKTGTLFATNVVEIGSLSGVHFVQLRS